MDAPALQEILIVSRRNNEHAGLTGMLLYADEHFIQTLEGEDELVLAAFERIGRDTRHRNIMVALQESISERVFLGWSMGFCVLSGDEVARTQGFTDFLDPDSKLYGDPKAFGRPGAFHRMFRQNMRLEWSEVVSVGVEPWMAQLITAARTEIADEEGLVGLVDLIARADLAGCGVVIEQQDGQSLRAQLDAEAPQAALRYANI